MRTSRAGSSGSGSGWGQYTPLEADDDAGEEPAPRQARGSPRPQRPLGGIGRAFGSAIDLSSFSTAARYDGAPRSARYSVGAPPVASVVGPSVADVQSTIGGALHGSASCPSLPGLEYRMASSSTESLLIPGSLEGTVASVSSLSLSRAKEALFRASKEGHLRKKGFYYLKRWITRWVALRGRILAYYSVCDSSPSSRPAHLSAGRRAAPLRTPLHENRALGFQLINAPRLPQSRDRPARGTLELTGDTSVSPCEVDQRKFGFRVEAPPAARRPPWILAAVSESDRVRGEVVVVVGGQASRAWRRPAPSRPGSRPG